MPPSPAHCPQTAIQTKKNTKNAAQFMNSGKNVSHFDGGQHQAAEAASPLLHSISLRGQLIFRATLKKTMDRVAYKSPLAAACMISPIRRRMSTAPFFSSGEIPNWLS
jgi:hypothetical protein